jgi:hypothetical protein
MVFDGAFHIPSWCRPGTQEGLNVGPEHLIRHCQREEGVDGDPNAGAAALAAWLMADFDRADREARRPGSPLSMGGAINRLLAGAILPSDPLAASIETMTGGAVHWRAWNWPAQGLAMDAAQIPADPPPPDKASCERVAVERHDESVEIFGLGAFTLRTSIAAAAMLHDGLAVALGR